ncbi:hypothetical protein RYX56_25690, partial [Alkalihalophilus lindianensis]
WTVDTPAGFADAAFHTPHPYRSSREHTLLVSQPVKVSAADPSIVFDEVAITEPCDDGTAYCTNGGLYDYLAVEATK